MNHRSPAARAARGIDAWLLPLALVVIVGLWLFTRFSSPSPSPPPADPPHAVGEQGGVLISLADDRYHVEALVDEQRRLHLFMLGRDPSQVIDVAWQAPIAYVHGGEFAVVRVPLSAEPQPGDPPQRTSRFSGLLPEELAEGPLRVTVSPLHIDAGRYRAAFVWAEPNHQPAMPTAVAADEQRELYLTPGGVYSEADIEANGRQTAAEKFVGFQAAHDFNPQPGDALCPITRTKAHPDCDWQVNGRRYTFCCPPCVDEFVQLAKQQPSKIEPPEAYVQEGK
ncbi:MAG: hypothetical protein WD030_02405 [Pirellulales bacterium]